MRRIQAYFRTEDEAEGAKTALLSYKVEGLDVWPLTDPLSNNGGGRSFLLPLVPYGANLGGSSTAMGASAATYPAGTHAGVLVPPVIAGEDGKLFGKDDDLSDKEIREHNKDPEHSELSDSDLSQLSVVMELKASDEDYNEVVHTLRGKNAYIEVFE